MKLSMMSYTMARQVEKLDVPAMMKLTRELDFDGIDFVSLHDNRPEDLRKMADDIGVPIICHTFFADDLNHPEPQQRREGLETCRRGIEAAVILGAPVIMIPTPAKEGKPREASRRDWIEGLKEVASLTRSAGIQLTIENFPGVDSPFVIADDLLEGIAEVPGLKITYDSGNAFTGEDPLDSFFRTAEYTVHVHFKDWTTSPSPKQGYYPMLDGRYYRPALIGEGEVDNEAILQALQDRRYDGYINIEYQGDDYPADEALRRAVAYLRENIAR